MIKQTGTLYAFEREQFEEFDGVVLALEEPTPDPENPIVRPGDEGEPDSAMVQFLSTILPRDDGWTMWYTGWNDQAELSYLSAWSPDGLSWQKRGPITGIRAHSPAFTVFEDQGAYICPVEDIHGLRPEATRCETHRRAVVSEMCLNGTPGVPCVVGFATSADGCNFSLPATPYPVSRMKFEAPRLYRFGGRYIMAGQTNGRWVGLPASRVAAFYTSDDLLNWELEPGGMMNESWNRQTHCGIAPIKCIDDRLLIGLGGRFDDASEVVDQHFDITLLYSYDGLVWQHVIPGLERRSWIRRGRGGDWDFGGVMQGEGLVECDEDAYIYYGGSRVGNLPHTASWLPGGCAIGRVRFTRDRFVCVKPRQGWRFVGSPEPTCGIVTTRDLVASGRRRLCLNAEQPDIPCACLHVELMTPEGRVRSQDTCTGSGVCVPVDIELPPQGETFRLRITFIGGDYPDLQPQLYAVYH